MNKEINKDIEELLNEEARRINNISFIAEDPVQFPRRFSQQEDIEIVSFLAALLAWGNRKMICRDIEKILSMMNNEPYLFMKEKEYENIDPKRNIHRTFFGKHLIYFLKGLRPIYEKFGNLDSFSKFIKAGETEFPSWKLVEEMQKIMSSENSGEFCSQCLPINLKTTALKRINMALRWMVRDDGIVDMGIWNSIPKSKLFIPLDVHVGNISRELGILNRKSNDRKSVEELTSYLRKLNPDDPTLYDFALFGIGVERRKKEIIQPIDNRVIV